MSCHLRRLSVRLTLLVVAALLLAPTSASATRKAIWGPVTLPSGESAFPTYKTLGVDVFQVQLQWALVAPSRPDDATDPDDPAYRWDNGRVAEAVAAARGSGIDVALMVKNTPDWANGGRGIAWAPNRTKDYAEFVEAAARRYPSVRFWMIWGETDSRLTFNPLPDNSRVGPRRYAKLLDAAYVRLKRRSRRNVVIGGMTNSLGQVRNSDFVKFLRLPNGRPPRMNWWGHNPFGPAFPNLKRSPLAPGRYDFAGLDTYAKRIRATYRHYGRKAPRIWISEYTISSDRGNRAFDFFVSRKKQARSITAAYKQIDRHSGLFAGLGWFNLLDEATTVERGLTTGLLTYEGDRKPSFRAYQRAR